MAIAPFWEEQYAKADGVKTFHGGKPSEKVVQAAQMLPKGGRALDLGCGAGRDSLYLAKAGFEVASIDISETGIARLKEEAKNAGLTIHAWVGDMASFRFEGTYDLIIAIGCLHLLARSGWQHLIARAKEHTRPLGLNVMTGFTDESPTPPDMAPYFKGLFRPGELFKVYEDWDIVDRNSFTFSDDHGQGLRHTHTTHGVVARRPEGL
jgi:tellurite methyltransferase